LSILSTFHIRRLIVPSAPDLILTPQLTGLFSLNFINKRLNADYVSRIPDYLMELVGILKGMGEFWQPPEQG